MKPLKIAIGRIAELHNTALYFERAARALGHEVILLSTIDSETVKQPLDLLLVVDPWFEGLKYLPEFDCPTAVVLIDVHRELHTRTMIARFFDHAFVAQRDFLADIAAGIHTSVHWLPLGGDPEIHFVPDRVRDFEVGFVGKLGIEDSERNAVLSEVLDRFHTNRIESLYTPREMGEVYSRSKIVLNKSIGGDLNMRFFEALASGALLVTDRIENGLDELATEDIHYVGYDGAAEAISKIRHYLRHERARERIARAGRQLLLERHTYVARMEQILDTVTSTSQNSAPARQAPQSEFLMWRAEWARKRGISPCDAAQLISEGLPVAGIGHIAVGIARNARHRLRDK